MGGGTDRGKEGEERQSGKALSSKKAPMKELGVKMTQSSFPQMLLQPN